MARGKRRKEIGAGRARVSLAAAAQHPTSNIQHRTERPPTALPDHRWRTFPVFAAFFAGMLVAFLVNEGSANPVAFFFQLAALFGVGYALAHLIVRNVVLAGRLRRRQQAAAAGEDGEEYEDVVVYDEDAVRSE